MNKMVHPITKSPSGIDLWLWVSVKKSTNIFDEGQIWKHPSAWNATGKREVGGPRRAQTQSCSRWETRANLSVPGCESAGISQLGGSWGSKFLRLDIWKPCVHISAFVALPWGTAWLWPTVPDSWIPTLANRLHYPEPWERQVIHPPQGPFIAVCSLFSPWSLPAFESQTTDKLECVFPAQWDFG